jgi:hypothetical protein
MLNPIPARFLHEEPHDGATGTTEIRAKCLSPREDGSGLICQTNTQANLTGLGQPHSSGNVPSTTMWACPGGAADILIAVAGRNSLVVHVNPPPSSNGKDILRID